MITNHLKQLSAEVNTLRRSLKKSYFAKGLNEAGKNSKAAWKVIHDRFPNLSDLKRKWKI